MRWVLAVFVLLLALPTLSRAGEGEICDRNGVVLARIDYSGESPKWTLPFGALAIHVLEGLNKEVLPGPGQKLILTIDARVQTAVEEELRQVERGAAVVVDPADGRILAIASVPSYLVSDAWEQKSDDLLMPMLNRSVMGYVPGNAYFPVIALAGASIDKQGSKFRCVGGVQIGSKFIKCHNFGKGTHGDIDVKDALKNTCGAFFLQYAREIGIPAITRTGEMLGLGLKTGLPLRGEMAGKLPDEETFRYPKERRDSDVLSKNIGRGLVTITPVQMAMLSGTLANGGQSYVPRLIERLPDGTESVPSLRANLLEKGITPETMKTIREGLLEWLRPPKSRPGQNFTMAGGRGSAQTWTANGAKDNVYWEFCFAPYGKPRVALSVMTQGERYPSIASKIAGRILAEQLPEVVYREPNRGIESGQ